MSKWNKGHGLIVPIDSLLKEKENTNRPAPLRSAGLVGRWGITSFTSIRNTSYEFESTSPKESDDLNCPSSVASLSTQVPNPIKPKKFFKSRNTLPPVAATPDPHRDAAGYGSPQQKNVLLHQAAQLQARIAQDAGGSPPYVPAGYYQPLGASTSAEGKAPGKKKSKKKKQKQSEGEAGEESAVPAEKPSSAKKEKPESKKEKKQKKVKKEVELPPELPKRNSSRIRNKVVNYNEDDDSFDMIPYRDEVSRTPPVSKLALEPAPVPEVPEPEPVPVEKSVAEEEDEEEVEEEDDEEQEVPQEEAPAPGGSVTKSVGMVGMPVPAGLASPTKASSGGEDRVKTREHKEMKTVPVPLSSPSVVEHPPIVLRISKGTSRLISTDSEDVNSPPHGSAVQQPAVAPAIPHQPTPPASQESEPPAPLTEPAVNPVPSASATFVTGLTPPEEEPKKDDLKIKITLSKGLISNGGSSSKHKKESKKELRHFKKRAIAREKGRSSKRAKRGEGGDTQEEDDERKDEELLGGVAEDLRVDPIVLPNIRPQFPLPGTDAYELYRTLASPSGGDDFDSQSSILGSASSNNTPKHVGLTAADDCRIIHSRGSSDCGSDLELSQNSSTAAAPPSEINFESENTQDNKEEEAKEVVKPEEEKKEPPKEERVEVLKLSLKGTRSTRTTRSKMKNTAQVEVISKPEPIPVPAAISSPEPAVKKFGRATRNRNNNNNVVAPEVEPVKEVEPVPEPVREPSPPLAPVQKAATRQYSRRKKNVVPPDYQHDLLTSPKRPALEPIDSPPPFTLSSETESALASMKSPRSSALTTGLDLTTNSSRTEPAQPAVSSDIQDENKPEPTEYKIKNKFKRSYFRSEELAKQQQLQESRPLAETSAGNNTIPSAAPASALTVPPITIPIVQPMSSAQDQQQQPVKLVISKKKGSIFKSRPLTGSAEAADKKRHVYKHKWDDDDEDGKDKGAMAEAEKDKQPSTFEGEPSGLSRVTRMRSTGETSMEFDDEFDFDTKLKCDRDTKPYYTVVRNVKKAHQIQEIGESQEMDDDVEYILSALQPDNPNATRCLSAMTLATKCMTPAFRMHVRAHGVVTRFFKALRDAHTDQSLGLCTATIMFVLSQDTLNMDLDRDSLELMLNLLDTDHRSGSDGGLSKGQLEKNQQKVRELCEEIKNSGKAKHMDLDNITTGSLAMESLLSLTSKRAGEWFKDELRNLGGLEHLIKTVSDCCRQISDYVIEWTDDLLSKLQKIERCLRVLENVTILNEQNQSYILNYNGGRMITTLVKLLKLIDGEVVLYPTTERTPKEDRGAVLREMIIPVLKLFITLTHPFNDTAYGASVIGSQPHVIATSLHLLLRLGDYVPQKFIFEMNILVLLFLINLTIYTQSNRHHLMTARAPDDFGTTAAAESSRTTRGAKATVQQEMAIQALVDYFYRQDELARYAEKNTDAILEAKSKKNEDIEETVTKLLQKAGSHMEHTLMASYVALLIGWLVKGSDEYEATVRCYLKDGNFLMMVNSLEKYHNFLNLTANSDASSLQHVRQTKNIIDNLKKLDSADRQQQQPEASTSSSSQQSLPTASSSSSTSIATTASNTSTPHRYGSRSSTRAHY